MWSRASVLLILLTYSVNAGERLPSAEEVLVESPAGLVTTTAVQSELNLTQKESQTIFEALQPQQTSYATAVAALSNRPPAEARAEQQKLAEELRKQSSQLVFDRLSAEQSKRLRQIVLQVRGPAVFADPEVQKALALTAEQRRKHEDLRDEFERDMSRLTRTSRGIETNKTIPGTDLPQSGQKSLLGVTPMMLRKEYALAAKNVLTGDQLMKWYELIGDPFPRIGAKK